MVFFFYLCALLGGEYPRHIFCLPYTVDRKKKEVQAMSNQFPDLRISEASNSSTGVPQVPITPALFGDIGLQTAVAVGTSNQNSVRVALWGTVGVSASSAGSM
jgi:hypothetical protein